MSGGALARRFLYGVRDLYGRIRGMFDRAPNQHWRTLDPRWAELRDRHLAAHPRCAARSGSCSGRREVHHVKPRHLYPELEYEESNLLTLCEYHHFVFGHGGDWWGWVPESRRIAERSRIMAWTNYDDVLLAQRQRIYSRLNTRQVPA